MADEVALVMPFTLNPLTGTINSTTNQSVIWSNRVRMAVETTLGERVMRPTYGSKIPSTVFATTDTFVSTVQSEVSRIFVEQLPLLTFISVHSTLDTKLNVLSVEITYALPNQKTQTTVAGVAVVSDTHPFYEELS